MTCWTEDDKKILCQMLGKLYFPDEVDENKVRTLKQLLNTLQTVRHYLMHFLWQGQMNCAYPAYSGAPSKMPQRETLSHALIRRSRSDSRGAWKASARRSSASWRI